MDDIRWGALSDAIRPNLLGLFFGVLAIPSPRRVVVIAYSGAFLCVCLSLCGCWVGRLLTH